MLCTSIAFIAPESIFRASTIHDMYSVFIIKTAILIAFSFLFHNFRKQKLLTFLLVKYFWIPSLLISFSKYWYFLMMTDPYTPLSLNTIILHKTRKLTVYYYYSEGTNSFLVMYDNNITVFVLTCIDCIIHFYSFLLSTLFLPWIWPKNDKREHIHNGVSCIAWGLLNK